MNELKKMNKGLMRKDGKYFLPITHESLVMDNDGNTLNKKYATKDFVKEEIQGAVLEGVEIDLTDYPTIDDMKDYVDGAIENAGGIGGDIIIGGGEDGDVLPGPAGPEIPELETEKKDVIGAINENKTSIDTIKDALSALEKPPIYKMPDGRITATPNLVELGADTSVVLNGTFIQNDAGALKDTKFYLSTTNTPITNQYTINKTTKFKVLFQYDAGAIKNTNLGNPYPDTSIKAGTLVKELEVRAVGATYYGTSKNTLQKVIKNTKEFTWSNITCDDDVLVYKYPKDFGPLTTIKDNNNFEYINSYTLTEETINNIVYFVYTLTDPMTAEGTIQIYK